MTSFNFWPQDLRSDSGTPGKHGPARGHPDPVLPAALLSDPFLFALSPRHDTSARRVPPAQNEQEPLVRVVQGRCREAPLIARYPTCPYPGSDPSAS